MLIIAWWHWLFLFWGFGVCMWTLGILVLGFWCLHEAIGYSCCRAFGECMWTLTVLVFGLLVLECGHWFWAFGDLHEDFWLFLGSWSYWWFEPFFRAFGVCMWTLILGFWCLHENVWLFFGIVVLLAVWTIFSVGGRTPANNSFFGNQISSLD